ncbi:MAG: glycoside hydrolase [Ruminococcus sp.]|nr:glycoside hydrolase [Ruminococcus sp.]
MRRRWKHIFEWSISIAVLSGCLTGCAETISQDFEDFEILTPVATTTTTTEVTEAETEPPVQYQEIAVETPEIEQTDVSLTLEAEDTAIPEYCSVAIMPRLGYSGTGYLSNLSADNNTSITMEVEIPATQHYDITVIAGCNTSSTYEIITNNETIYTLEIETETENFVRSTIQGIFLSEGTCEITIKPTDGTIDVDCIELTNNTSLYEEDTAIADTPVDSEASDNTVKLYQFLTEHYGSEIITGQYVSDNTDAELEKIYQTTGKYPLIRFDDLQPYSLNGGDAASATVIDDSLAWAEKGGIVGLIWSWNAPTGTADIYTENTTFSLENAIIDEEVALCSDSELSAMSESGTISEDCYALIQDIDAIAEALQILADADVPVLWRPLMEASGDWYWWGASGADAYTWLWDLLYTRLTDYHELHNLIWIWNGQSDSYLVDEDKYDIASLDLYISTDETFGSRYEQYVALRNMTTDKILAISECSTLPDINTMFRDNAVWSFFGLWYSPYLDEEYTSDDLLIHVYNSEASLTLGDYTG